MSEAGKKKRLSNGILSEIKGNLHRDDFVKYMEFCVKKWKRLDVELQIIDAIMASICKAWNVSKQELMNEKKMAEPRAMMYYVIKKQVDLSYQEIGEMFGINKSYIHKAVDDIAFLVEDQGDRRVPLKQQKNMVTIFQSIQKDLSKKNVMSGLESGVKN